MSFFSFKDQRLVFSYSVSETSFFLFFGVFCPLICLLVLGGGSPVLITSLLELGVLTILCEHFI